MLEQILEWRKEVWTDEVKKQVISNQCATLFRQKFYSSLCSTGNKKILIGELHKAAGKPPLP